MLVAGIIAAIVVAAILYWLLIATEGTYLGPRIVTLLYDWTAPRYDRIKELRFVHEMQRLGIPLAEALAGVASPRVLDVATGTGRLPQALLYQVDLDAHVVGIDRSGPMLAQARPVADEYDGRAAFIQGDAESLPFRDATFDAVTCLEALEFMSRPGAVIDELLRVLKPGGVMLVSNRVGADAWLFPGRLCGRGRLERYLERAGATNIDTERWQVHYDLIWALKPDD